MNELISADTGNFIGMHALLLYLIGLATLIVFSLSSYFVVRYFQRNHSPYSRNLPLYFAAGIITFCVAGFSLITIALAKNAVLSKFFELSQLATLTQFDKAFASSIASNTPVQALHFFAWLTHAGDTLTYTVICIATACALLLRKHYMLALAVVLAIGGNSILNRSLKAIFERVRPEHEHGLVVAHGWSFPSGHSSGAVVTYGIVAYLLLRLTPSPWHPAILLSAVSLAFTIGMSRVFLQVHYLSDVAAGFMSGLCWLTLCILTISLLGRHKITPGLCVP